MTIGFIGGDLGLFLPRGTKSTLEMTMKTPKKTAAATITVVVKEPGKKARIQTILSTLESFQRIVGGFVQPLPLGKEFTMYVDEDGQAKGLPLNVAYGPSERLQPLVGTVVVTKCRRNGEALTLSSVDTARIVPHLNAAAQILGLEIA